MWSKMDICFYVNYPMYLSDFNKTWILSTDFRKILKCQMSRKPLQWNPSCSLRKDWLTDRQTKRLAEGQADMTKLTVVFRNFSFCLKARLKNNLACIDNQACRSITDDVWAPSFMLQPSSDHFLNCGGVHESCLWYSIELVKWTTNRCQGR